MAPPRKRRRLFQSLPDDMALFEPVPTLPYSVSGLEYTADTRAEPNRIEEVHFHIEKRSVEVKKVERAVLQRRQTAYPITTVDANGNTIVSTLTVGLGAGAAISGFPATSTQTTPSGNNNSPDRTPNTEQGTVTSDRTDYGPTATGSGSGTTRQPVYTATLTNGNVRTITRSAGLFVTTFGDGEVSTICGRNGPCALSGAATNQSPLSSGQSSAMMNGNGAGQSTVVGASGGTSSASQSNNDSGPSLGTIAGSVVGGCAALALLLILALVFLRWYKRRLRNGHQELSRDLSPTPEPENEPFAGDMAENAGLTPLVGVTPGLFQHQNKSAEEPGSAERSFAKVSGRKLPSAFGEGVAQRDMNSPPPAMPLTTAEKDLHGNSFYRDSTGFYGGDGTQYATSVSPEPSQTSDTAPAAMTLSAGPERRPTIHEPDPYVMEPSVTQPNTPARNVRESGTLSPDSIERSGTPTLWRSETPTLGRSDTPSTIADNRSSRFTEDF